MDPIALRFARTIGGNPPPGMDPSGEMTSRARSPMERVNDWLSQNWYGDSREGYQKAARATNVLQTVAPPIAAAEGMYQAGQDAGAGNYATAGIGLGMAGLPLPGMVKRGGRKMAKEAWREAEGSLPPIGHNQMSVYDLPAGSDPSYLGAAPDRSPMTFLRYTPAKLSPRMARAQEAIRDPNNPIRHQMMKDIEFGRNFKGADWYNTEELRNWFIKELGPQQGHDEWLGFIKHMGASSAGSNVLTNIKNASALRNIEARNPQFPGSDTSYLDTAAAAADTGMEAFNPFTKARTALVGEPGYGHRYNGLHHMTAQDMYAGGWSGAPEPGTPPPKGSWTRNPKPKGFFNSFTGNPNNIAADLHFTRYMGMASQHPDWLVNGAEVSNEFKQKMLAESPGSATFFRSKPPKATDSAKAKAKDIPMFDARKAFDAGHFNMKQATENPAVWSHIPNDNEYGAMEKLMAEVGKETGLTASQVQAALWMGAADRTGVHKDSLGTFMELIRNRADARAKATNSTRSEVLRNFIVNKGLLSAAGVGVGTGALASNGGQDNSAQASVPTLQDLIQKKTRR